MSTENIITIFTTLAFGPAMAVVLLRWVLNRASTQDSRLEAQAAEIAKLQARVDELEGEGRAALAARIQDSIAEESRLVGSIERIGQVATRLAAAVDALEQAMALRTCQLPGPILAKVQDLMREWKPAGA